jgi:hypothetical protein
MFALNLPAFDYKIRQYEGKNQIFDFLRRKYVVLTPEEWVRQHFTHYLVSEKGYPAGRMANESMVLLHGQKRRCDTVIYDEIIQPLVIVEYKAPEVQITQAVFDQIAAYNMVLKVKYLMVSNGLRHYCCRMDYDKQQVTYLKEIPVYREI